MMKFVCQKKVSFKNNHNVHSTRKSKFLVSINFLKKYNHKKRFILILIKYSLYDYQINIFLTIWYEIWISVFKKRVSKIVSNSSYFNRYTSIQITFFFISYWINSLTCHRNKTESYTMKSSLSITYRLPITNKILFLTLIQHYYLDNFSLVHTKEIIKNKFVQLFDIFCDVSIDSMSKL